MCETGSKIPAVLAGVLSHPLSIKKGVQTSPPKDRDYRNRPCACGRGTTKVDGWGEGETMAGKEQKPRVELEAGFADIKGKEGELPPGWEWI